MTTPNKPILKVKPIVNLSDRLIEPTISKPSVEPVYRGSCECNLCENWGGCDRTKDFSDPPYR